MIHKSRKFTVFTVVYYGLYLFKQAIHSVIDQTYDNLQIIIINNGASEVITNYVNDLVAKDKRVTTIRYQENVFSYKDHELCNYVTWNDALKHAKGDFIRHIQYDDLMAPDFVERMVRLFEENTDCTTAKGRSVSMDIDGIVNEKELNNRKTNFRPRYMPGYLLALATLEKYRYTKGLMHADPGQLFTIKCDVLRKYGGYHRSLDFSQLYGIVPFGVTGFDEDAIYYWRRHEGQLNKELNSIGITNADNNLQMLKDFDIKKRWQIYGPDVADFVVRRYKSNINRGAADWFAVHFMALNLKACFRIISDTGHQLQFWLYVPKSLWDRKHEAKSGLFKLFKPVVKPIVNLVYRLNGRKEMSNKLFQKLYLKVNQ